MSGKIAIPFYDERRAQWRWKRGNETYYNEKNEMIEFATYKEAVDWLKAEHPEMVIQIPEGMQVTFDLKEMGNGNT